MQRELVDCESEMLYFDLIYDAMHDVDANTVQYSNTIRSNLFANFTPQPRPRQQILLCAANGGVPVSFLTSRP